ncbi:MAG: VWA domain-containing protein [Labrys sp. (in: a-proteobacteria)]
MTTKPTETDKTPSSDRSRAVASNDTVAAFLEAAKAAPRPVAMGDRGRLIFALDATMSRQPTWDLACRLQAEMFQETVRIGGLDVQLVYFRGHSECRASRWMSDPDRLGAVMGRIDCRGGHTQVERVLSHALAETRLRRVQAVVFVGDAMEEKLDDLAARAGELALLGVPLFVFQEGHDPVAEAAYRELARMTRGAWCRFDPGAAHQLSALLRAVAAYAGGGKAALQALAANQNGGAKLLLDRMGG